MCPPTYLPALRGERLWVLDGCPLDPTLARDQWQQLRELVSEHVAATVLLQAEPWAPAMTFTRDLALVIDDVVVPFMPDSTRGPFEAPLAHKQLRALGLTPIAVDEPMRFDGGNVLADTHGRLLIGVTTPSPAAEFIAAVRVLESSTGRPAYRVPLAGGRFPHVDMAICDLNGRAWLVYPNALAGYEPDDAEWTELFLGRPVIAVSSEDGEQLACNLIVHDDLAIGPTISTDLRHKIEHVGIRYLPTPLSELRKAGGGAHCLTLELHA